MRRTSSVTKTKSRLSDVTPITESETITAEPASETSTEQPESEAVAAEPESDPAATQPRGQTAANPETVKPSSSAAVPEGEVSPIRADRPRQHRGSDIAEASIEEIRAMEKKWSIPEEGEEDEEDEDEADATKPVETTKASTVSATDGGEAKATKYTDIQETDPKDADRAGISVGD